MTERPASAQDGFEVARWVDALGGFISRHRSLWTRLGNLETTLVGDTLEGVAIDRPIYVSGLARSGTTILLEMLARHGDTVTHRYRDYPPVFTPYWWNRVLDFTPQQKAEPVERTHKDGIRITPDSPEALEEVLWMAFFPGLHDPRQNAALDGRTSHPAFEGFYRDHIRKLLKVRGGSRYLAKGNYNVTRLEYLLTLFPDARFVVPVREPGWHIASLMKQHALFCEGGRRRPESVRHLQRVGHYEFGLDRRPVNAGDPAAVEQVLACWQGGAEVEGWARYWSHIYGYVADRLEASPQLRDATLVVRYEDLCRERQATLRGVLEHCRLAAGDDALAELASELHSPTYYQPRFTPGELAIIDRHTQDTAARFGYGAPAATGLSASA
jgi:Sulfotransferase family